MKYDNCLIKLEDDPSKEKDEYIRKQLHDFNINQIGKEEQYSVYAYNDSNIIGGVLVAAEKKSIYVDVLWVDEYLRGLGIGSQLLIAAEAEAINRKIFNSTLDTLSFQSKSFYLKHGYQQIGIIENYIEGYDRIFFRKSL